MPPDPREPRGLVPGRRWCRRCMAFHATFLWAGQIPVVSCPKQPKGTLDLVPTVERGEADAAR